MLLNNLYTIESLTEKENQIHCSVQLDVEHAIFSGHFPGHPVLPGVCMMEMISEIVGRVLQQSFRITDAPMIKFLNMINPKKNPSINLEINYQPAAGSATSSGKIFSGPLVFMKFQMTLQAVQ